jgi:hypothetical protein
VQLAVWAVVIEAGEQTIATEVMVEAGLLTATFAEPALVVSCVEVAVMVAVPVAVGVKTPEALTEPIVEGLTDHVTALLKLPVPVTVGVQVDVWLVRIEDEKQRTETEVIVGGVVVTVTVAEPDLEVSWVDVAVIVTVPGVDAVNTPAAVTVPILVGLTDHVTELL